MGGIDVLATRLLDLREVPGREVLVHHEHGLRACTDPRTDACFAQSRIDDGSDHVEESLVERERGVTEAVPLGEGVTQGKRSLRERIQYLSLQRIDDGTVTGAREETRDAVRQAAIETHIAKNPARPRT